MRSRILASAAVAALLAAPAFAQSSGSTAPTAPSSTESRSDSAAPATGSAAGSSATTPGASTAPTSGAKSADSAKPTAPAQAIIPTQEQGQLTADNLIGMTVRNPQDEKVGTIEDLVLDTDMKVVGIVVSVGGFLGIGKHDVALNRDEVQIAAAGDRNARVATVSMTKEQLKAAPEFKTLERQQAEAEQERAKQSQGTAAGSGARPTGSGATGAPPARSQ